MRSIAYAHKAHNGSRVAFAEGHTLRRVWPDTASPDAIPFGKLAQRGADSAARLKESPRPRTLKKPKPATRAGHNFPAEAGEILIWTIRSFPQLRPVSQAPSLATAGESLERQAV
jgi:hypothetical protein